MPLQRTIWYVSKPKHVDLNPGCGAMNRGATSDTYLAFLACWMFIWVLRLAPYCRTQRVFCPPEKIKSTVWYSRRERSRIRSIEQQHFNKRQTLCRSPNETHRPSTPVENCINYAWETLTEKGPGKASYERYADPSKGPATPHSFFGENITRFLSDKAPSSVESINSLFSSRSRADIPLNNRNTPSVRERNSLFCFALLYCSWRVFAPELSLPLRGPSDDE